MSIAVDTATPMLSIEQRKRARNVGFSLIFLALISAFFFSGRPGDGIEALASGPMWCSRLQRQCLWLGFWLGQLRVVRST